MRPKEIIKKIEAEDRAKKKKEFENKQQQAGLGGGKCFSTENSMDEERRKRIMGIHRQQETWGRGEGNQIMEDCATVGNKDKRFIQTEVRSKKRTPVGSNIPKKKKEFKFKHKYAA